MIDPDYIASIITEYPDIINEGLYGYTVKTTNKPIDQFINAIESDYSVDWDPQNKKFISLFKLHLPDNDINDLSNLVKQSSQIDELKQVLINKLNNHHSVTTIYDVGGNALYASKRSSLAAAVEEAVGSRVDLSQADLTNIKIPNIDLSGAKLMGADLTDADLTDTTLRFANLEYAWLMRADLISANLYGADLTNADLREANLAYSKLTSAELANAMLMDAALRSAKLISTKLTNADLTNADLTDADLRNADLTNADLSYSNITQAQLNSAKSINGIKRQ